MIPTHPFGRTNHESTRIIFGAAALSAVSQDEADRTIELMLQHGINHIDVAASYGEAEDRLGPWLKDHRDEVFLATKTGERTSQPAYDQIRRSLERMQVDNIDLIQLHNLAEEDEWEVALGAGGALEAAVRARDEGLVKFIGVTGHGVGIADMHKRSLARFDFDSVLLPYNYPMMQNPQYAADFESLATICLERNVAFQTIKAITKAPWGDRPHTTSTWYEPLQDQAAIDQAVAWVLGRPGVFLNTVGDIHILPMVLDAAERFETRPTDQEMRDLVEQWQAEPLFV
ncbi:MAG: aldo/keto reductase [Chloroflexota bacterium]|nr:aldo/keto reductase [Chloroflexota bacterium]